jgi:hypothetical protein
MIGAMPLSWPIPSVPISRVFVGSTWQYFGHFLSERVNKKGHSWLNVSAQRYLQPGNGL